MLDISVGTGVSDLDFSSYLETYYILLFTFPVATFDPDTKFISNVLSRLEAVMGVHIVSVLANIHYQLTTTSGVQLQPQVR